MAGITAAVSPTSLTTTSGTTATSGTKDQEIAGNFQDFLTLLTTQLKNQSPLDPLDTNQFTQQLVQFASVEQQLKTNATLTTMAASSKASTASSAANLVGATVTVDGSTATYANGQASWTVTPSKAAASATITIKDSTGATVATQSKPLTAGAQTLSWDGRTASGGQAASGTYTISVVARDAAGQAVSVATDLSGQVSSVDITGDTPILTIGGSRLPLSSIKSVGT